MLMTNDDEENFIEETSLQNYKYNDKFFFFFYHYCYKSNKLEIQKINYKKIIKIKRTRRDSKC